MKKILIFVLLLFSCLLSACSKDYNKIKENLKNLDLEEVSENEILEYSLKIKEKNNEHNFITIESNAYYKNENFEEKVTKYQKDEQILSKSLKTPNKNYIEFYETKKVYCNDKYNNIKFSYGGNIVLEAVLNSGSWSSYWKNDLLYSLSFNDAKIGKDKSGNIVVYSKVIDGSKETYYKIVYSDYECIEYEKIDFINNEFDFYVIEKYSYKNNGIKYPNPDKYEFNDKMWYGPTFN